MISLALLHWLILNGWHVTLEGDRNCETQKQSTANFVSHPALYGS